VNTIHLKTKIPGPKSQAILARRQTAVPTGLARATDVVVKSAEGAVVHDIDGNTLIDMAGGIGMLNAGHCPPTVVEAIQQQAAAYIHTCALVATYEPYIELCERLNAMTPGTFAKKTLLSNSGAEAVENAVKLSRAYTGKPAIVVFEGAYHGRTYLTMSLTSKYGLFKKGFGPFAPEIYRLPHPYPYRRPSEMSEKAYIAHCCDQLEKALISQVDPSAIAAILIEPIQGEAGFIPMPTAFLQKIRDICTQHNIVMIADEVQSGFGRTGKLFAIEHDNIVPDLITTAKSLGSGLPISAVTGRAEILDAAHPGGLGGTYSGSPIACVAALATLDQINQPAFLKRANEIGDLIANEIGSWRKKYPLIGDTRGVGAMQLIEFVLDPNTKTPAVDQTLQIVKHATANGLLLIRAGLYSNCIRLLPPLVITNEQCLEALYILRKAIEHVQNTP
jgi:4-aminobutyrate aminotransferase/(S)-3-amino-2-methylpropionate transaminase